MGNITWNSSTGKAYEIVFREQACEGHEETYTDEYGCSVYCSKCNHYNPTKRIPTYVPCPEYDAPTPGPKYDKHQLTKLRSAVHELQKKLDTASEALKEFEHKWNVNAKSHSV